MSVGVIIASVIIYFRPEWRIADPLCTFLFSIIVIFTTIPVVKECTFVLLEGSPDSIDAEELTHDLLNIKGVVDMHDFHFWAISINKFSLSAHLTSITPISTLHDATIMLRNKYNLFHTTIQVEPVEDGKHGQYHFKCEQDLHE